jgi:hypothetical protein
VIKPLARHEEIIAVAAKKKRTTQREEGRKAARRAPVQCEAIPFSALGEGEILAANDEAGDGGIVIQVDR